MIKLPDTILSTIITTGNLKITIDDYKIASGDYSTRYAVWRFLYR